MGTFNKEFTQQQLLKNLYKICTKFKTILQNCSEIKFNKILKHLRNFQNKS